MVNDDNVLSFAVFEAGGGMLNRRLVLSRTDNVYRHATEAYFSNAGWQPELGWELIEMVRDNIEVLHKARRRVTGCD